MGKWERQKKARKKAEKNQESKKPEPEEEVVDVDGLLGMQIEVYNGVEDVYRGEFIQLRKNNPDDLEGIGEIIAKQVEVRRQINILTKERERRRKEGNDSAGPSITLEVIKEVVEPVSNESIIAEEDDVSKLSGKAAEPILKESPENRKLKISYTREFILSLIELESCKKLPDGFDQSIIRWESRSSGSSDKDSDTQSDKDSDSGRHYGNQSPQACQVPEHDGLLGSGSFPRPAGDAGGISAPKVRPNDETFGSSEYTSEDRASKEENRRDSFELMRKEQQKAFQGKQKLKPEKPQTPASRPLVPPGFASTVLHRNLGTRSLNHSHQVQVGNSGLKDNILHGKGNRVSNGTSDIRAEKQLVEQMIFSGAVALNGVGSSNIIETPVQRSAEQPKGNVDNRASQQLLSLLQKGTGVKDFEPSPYPETASSVNFHYIDGTAIGTPYPSIAERLFLSNALSPPGFKSVFPYKCTEPTVLTCEVLERSILSEMYWSRVQSPEPSEVPLPRTLDLGGGRNEPNARLPTI